MEKLAQSMGLEGLLRTFAVVIVVGGLAWSLAAPAEGTDRQQEGAEVPPAVEFFAPEGRSAMPFSESVRVGNLLFLSGQIGAEMTEGGRALPAGGIGPETRQTMENIRQALARRGLSMSDVVKCTVMLADIDEWAAMNAVYRTFFSDHFPARSAFGSSGLALGARVEIECIAAFS